MARLDEPVAIIGSSCRFPGEVQAPSKLWDLLVQPRDLSARIPSERFHTAGFYHKEKTHHGSSNVQDAYVLSEDIRQFDAQFFNIKPIEAEAIDPQHRILLETVYEGLEAAGQSIYTLQGSSTSVYVGLMNADYNDIMNRDLNTLPQYTATGTARSILSNRISYFFDWHGPSMTIDTACSSSLVALHEAVRSVRSGDSPIAVAAGANLILGPEFFISTTNLGMLSPDGRSKMWDIDANGYARGDGFAAVILKPLSAALADGDHIDCLIRETGINQDGRTKGITMPSSVAQANLIRSTYAKAGLDPRKKEDRCQYFEAHGTGTPAGDPQEASAIASAFFEPGGKREPDEEPLYVGSIKTIIGHTEGTAGLAGVLKASLAMQHSQIPPNLLLNQLSPQVKPFYANLQIPKTVLPWPALPDGTPRRASVNSFGFGGTNAHVYEVSGERPLENPRASLPFVFSANSERSLKATLHSFSSYLEGTPQVNMRDLSWTLLRRTILPLKVAFSAATPGELAAEIDKELESSKESRSVGIRTLQGTRLLGIFTGQGAQWPQMGRQLVLHFDLARTTLKALETSLQELPVSDRPSWSIREELFKGASESRLGEAALSQPLCTAVQIVLVDLLRAAQVKFDAVVGHSSGEIAAAYVSGFVSARDAIRIAYYRGFHAHLARGKNGERGAMLAVGTSLSNAVEICNAPEFRGRISLAASNSSSSVTLSGDSDAISAAKAKFDQSKTFSRLLKVDTAYHSHHMLACSEPYIKSLQDCGVQVQTPPNGACTWFSSVLGERMIIRDELRGPYWRDNMVNTVLFSQAIDAALSGGGSYDLAIEIGPHPALKGPASQVLQETGGTNVPYVGTLTRGFDDVTSFSAALGFVWCNLGESIVNLASYDAVVGGDTKRRLLKGLPTYNWDHDRRYWAESRRSKATLGRDEPVHQLLGRKSPESTDDEARWVNVLKPKEIDWLSGHQIQGQTVFPAAGYVAMALEAVMVRYGEKSIQLIEIFDLTIDRSLAFDNDTDGIEVHITLSSSVLTGADTSTASFKCHAALYKQSSDLVLISSGHVRITQGDPSQTVLPPRPQPATNTIKIDVDRFYDTLGGLGYGYNGAFKALTSIQRKIGTASGSLIESTSGLERTDFLVHPASLDVSIQAIMAAYSYPGDGRFWSLHVPTSIKRIAVNPVLCQARPKIASKFDFNTTASDSHSSEIRGDIRLFGQHDECSMIEVEEVRLVPLSAATPANDRPMFARNVWDVAFPNADTAVEHCFDLDKEGNSKHLWIACTARQIIHRYPHMRILQIAGGTGESTQEIISQLGTFFDTYTFTDKSSEYVENARRYFPNLLKKLAFQELDYDDDITYQGIDAKSYDMIIAINIANKTASLEKLLRGMRSLLKPGGQLLMEENMYNRPTGYRYNDEGIKSATSWNASLRAAGFSGVDTITGSDGSKPTSSVFTSVATDERVDYLRNPLRNPLHHSLDPDIEDLVVIGGQILENAKLVEEIESLLRPRVGRIIIIDSLEHVHEHLLPSMCSVLSLSDLDGPLFMDFTNERLRGLQTMFSRIDTMVWVTRGCQAHEPFSNMTVGLGRSLALEFPHIHLQFLDLDPDERVDAQTLTSAMLRFHAYEHWEKNEQADILWTSEPELAVENGHIKIPRIIPDIARNERYNSSQRKIVKDVDPFELGAEIQSIGGKYLIRQLADFPLEPSATKNGNYVIKVSHSLSSCIKISPNCYLFPVIGEVDANGKTVFALSSTNSSIITVSESWTIQVKDLAERKPEALLVACGQILAKAISSSVPENSSVLIHEPPLWLTSALRAEAKHKILRLLLTTSTHSSSDSFDTIIHAQASSRDIRKLVPSDVTLFMDLSLANINIKSTGRRIAENLPGVCLIGDETAVFKSDSLLPSSASASSTISEVLKDLKLSEALPINPIEHSSLSPAELTHADSTLVAEVIDWTINPTIPIDVQPVDSGRLFNQDRTYLLVGLTGDLGLSLCEWMVDHGAKNVVLTSRNPQVDETWLKEVQKSGAIIKVCAVDIADGDDLQELYRQLSSTLPPIAGVVNGAMVLRDAPFFDLELPQFEAVLKPKVDGTIHLDRLFSSDIPLDFFILFSSVAAVAGNRTQTAYSAANMFMTALAAQRRQRGLAASVMHVGSIIDRGYMARELPFEVQKTIRREVGMWISERDVHQMFAEAILAGHPTTAESPEVVSAFHVDEPQKATKTNWYKNPRFGFCIQHKTDGLGLEDSQTKTSMSARLMAATTLDEVFEIAKESFIPKLLNILQLNSDEAGDFARILDSATDDLGVDSLIAVQVRSWFIDEMDVDLPVLKILSGASVNDLLKEAAEKYSEQVSSIVEVEQNPGNDDELIHLESKTEDESDLLSSINGETSTGASGTSTPSINLSSTSVSSVVSKDEYDVASLKPDRPKPNVTRSMDMSYGQSRFWFLSSFLRDPTTFNVTVSFRIKGNLRVGDLARAVQVVGQRHEALRTCFYTDMQSKPMQGVIQSGYLNLEEKTVSSDAEVLQEYNKLKGHVFDIQHGRTMRIILLSQSTILNHLLIAYHHINMDGSSLSVLLTELEKVYNHQTLPSNLLQYPDFAMRQRRDVQKSNLQNERNYWRQEFPDIPLPLPLFPLSGQSNRRPIQDYNFTRVDLKLDASFSTQIKNVARKCKVSTSNFFLATLRTMLFRFLDTDDLCVGIADANRIDSDATNSIGMYLNVLPLRFRLRKGEKFIESLDEAKKKSQNALRNSKLPFDALLDELDVPRSSAHSPLFQVFYDYRPGIASMRTFSDCQIEYTNFSLGRTAYDLVLDIAEDTTGEFVIMFKVQKYLYTLDDGKILASSFKSLLEAFAKNTDLAHDASPLFPQADVSRALKLGQGSYMTSDWPTTIPHRIDDIIDQNSKRTAVNDDFGNSLTYAQLAFRVDTIATSLLEKGAEGKRVAVFQEPTSDWVCSLLAVLRVGSVYVPLDLRNPFPRLAAIVRSSKPSVILAHAATAKDVPSLDPGNATTVNISDLRESKSLTVRNRALPDSPAVVLYTSGSTGTPKGILLKHSSLRNEIEGYIKSWNIGAEMVLQQSAYSFDFSLDQIFTALTNGGTVYTVSKSKRGDSVEIAKLIASQGITYTKATPSEYASWIRYGMDSLRQNSGWQFAFGGGETLNADLKADFRRLAKPQLRLFNSWGPAEITVSATKIEVRYTDDGAGDLPVGFPLPNYSVYIVDQNLRPLPVGVTGEIVVGGAGPAAGYDGDSVLTEQKFIQNPFASHENVSHEYAAKEWTTMYRTGDRGRLRDDGALMFDGRIDGDTQIKLRGLRIELEDLESSIIAAAGGKIAKAVASSRGEGQAQYLVAFVEFTHQDEPTKDERREYLRTLLTNLPLPQYMCPAMLVPIEQIPLNNHSKVDRLAIKSLPLPQSDTSTETEMELTETEKVLKSVWDDVLTPELTSQFSINASTDFFHIGGNSMLLVRLQAGIRDSFHVLLPMVQLLECTTLGAMAMRISAAAPTRAINWDMVTSLHGLSVPSLPSFNPTHSAKGRTVLLTGASGHLGRSVLTTLLADATITSIHAVGVRNIFPAHSHKITVHEGDLTAPQFGLPSRTFATLAATIDVIIHNGAKRAFFEAYDQLEVANVLATKEIIALAAPRKVPVRFLSSGAVTSLANGKMQLEDEDTVNGIRPPTDGTNGYLASKWAGEILLEHAAQEYGISVSIHRPFGVSAAASPSGREEQVLLDIKRCAEQLKLLPLEKGWTGHIDFSPIEEIASAVCSTSDPVSGMVKRLAYHADVRLDLSTLAEMLGKEIKQKEGFEYLDPLKWFGRIKKERFGWLMMSQDLWRTADGVQVRSTR
ncbi:MAG: hypothetical protein Q9157_004639 [Trypethelium eluteriae]